MAAVVHEITARQKANVSKKMSKGLTTLPDKFLDCRDPSTGHDWKRTENFHVVPASSEKSGPRTTHVARKFDCRRCGCVKTERYIIVRRQGTERLERIALDMDYPEGYLMPGIPRGVKPAEIVRAEQYRRALEQVVGGRGTLTSAAER